MCWPAQSLVARAGVGPIHVHTRRLGTGCTPQGPVLLCPAGDSCRLKRSTSPGRLGCIPASPTPPLTAGSWQGHVGTGQRPPHPRRLPQPLTVVSLLCSSKFRLSYYPHCLEAFTELLKNAFHGQCQHSVLGDFQPYQPGQAYTPCYFIHVVKKTG